jgi:hypothetical protein
MRKAEDSLVDAWINQIGEPDETNDKRLVVDWPRTKATTDNWHRTIAVRQAA